MKRLRKSTTSLISVRRFSQVSRCYIEGGRGLPADDRRRGQLPHPGESARPRAVHPRNQVGTIQIRCQGSTWPSAYGKNFSKKMAKYRLDDLFPEGPY